MTTAFDDAASGELKQSGAKEESSRTHVVWLIIFAFGAGCVTVELIRHLHGASDQAWFDLPILFTCLVFVRRCASRLWKRS
jgi:heme/copper-type cytochrome/quinol oxidase subunit 4